MLLPADESSQRKAFDFAKELGADMIVVPAEPASFAELDKLATDTGVNVAVVSQNTSRRHERDATSQSLTLD